MVKQKMYQEIRLPAANATVTPDIVNVDKRFVGTPRVRKNDFINNQLQLNPNIVSIPNTTITTPKQRLSISYPHHLDHSSPHLQDLSKLAFCFIAYY